MTSQVVQRARPLSALIWLLGRQRVKGGRLKSRGFTVIRFLHKSRVLSLVSLSVRAAMRDKIITDREFPKRKPFNTKFREFREEIVQKFPVLHFSENLGIPSEVVFFSGNFAKCRFIRHRTFPEIQTTVFVQWKAPFYNHS